MSLKADPEPNNNVSIEEEASAQLFVILFGFVFLLRTRFSFYALTGQSVRFTNTTASRSSWKFSLKKKKPKHFSSFPGRGV